MLALFGPTLSISLIQLLLLVDTRKVESGEKEGSKDWPPTVKLAINEKQFSS
jgi:hypothetical protein